MVLGYAQNLNPSLFHHNDFKGFVERSGLREQSCDPRARASSGPVRFT
jgi:hypothetical protein